jgi:hypothetical protein
MPSEFETGLMVGLLIGEGHFGGDGRQPHVTLRMHVRHEALFRWIERNFPGGRLYGPYHHDGRDYFQWMARGRYLVDELLPLLLSRMSPTIDTHSYERLVAMQSRYADRLGRFAPAKPSGVDEASGGDEGDERTDRPERSEGAERATGVDRTAEIFAQLRAERAPGGDDA